MAHKKLPAVKDTSMPEHSTSRASAIRPTSCAGSYDTRWSGRGNISSQAQIPLNPKIEQKLARTIRNFPVAFIGNNLSVGMLDLMKLGSRQEIIPQYGEGFWFVIKAHPPAHIEICAGGCNAEDGPKDQ
jgi:hypothetical protein